MKRFWSVFLVVLMLVSLCACGNVQQTPTIESQCSHNYYLSDYHEPTELENGYNVYTCSKCGDSYREIIPKLQPSQSDLPVGSSEQADRAPSVSDYSRENQRQCLFDLRTYSEANSILSAFSWRSETVDSKGYKHTPCYLISCSQNNDQWARWELNGSFSVLEGTLYFWRRTDGLVLDDGSADSEFWLEIYNGEDFIARTNSLSESNPVVDFNLDIQDVNYLTIYFCMRTSDVLESNAIIADNIYIS